MNAHATSEETVMKKNAPPPPPRSHGYSTANADPVRSNMVKPGRFGFLFPELSTSPWTTGSPTTDAQVAEELGAAMHAPVTNPTPGVIPAGFTYFGQFVDHDITFDPTSLGENAVDVADLVNFRSPALDLDSLYGSGPRDQPFLYRRQTETSANQFILGPVKDSGPGPGTELPQVHALDGAKGLGDQVPDAGRLEGLLDDPQDLAAVHSLDDDREVGPARHEHADAAGHQLAQGRQDPQTVAAGHVVVHDGQIEDGVGGVAERFLAVARGHHRVALTREYASHGPANQALVVDY